MITIDLSRNYGYENIEDLYRAIKMLQENGWSDEEINAILERSEELALGG